MEASDQSLLERFARDRDEAAFRVLVGRHLDLVHAVARRVTDNGELARDVAQATFIRLAEHAAAIPRGLSLTAWLHRTTRSLAIDLVRAEVRRKRRENAATFHDPMNTPDADWSMLAPVIDELVDALPAADRELVLAKYYRNEPHAGIAARLGLTEANARKRASRALEKLRVLLGRRGIATTAAALATVLPAHAIPAAPASLALTVSAAGCGVVPAAPPAFSLHLAMTASQKSAVAAASVVFLASLGYAIRPVDQAAASVLSATAGAITGDAEALLPRRTIRPLPASAAERLERLRGIVALNSPAQQTREMLDFVDRLPAGDFRETADFFDALPFGDLPGWAFDVVLSAWAKADPLAAAEWTRTRDELKRPTLLTVLACWGEDDPDAALDWVTRNFPDATGSSFVERRKYLAVLTGMATRDIGAAVEALEAIPDEKDRTQTLIDLVTYSLGSSRPGSLDAFLEKVKAGPARSQLVAGSLLRLVSSGHGEKAWSLLEADEGARKIMPAEEFFARWQTYDAAGARAGISSLPEGSLRDEAVKGVCSGSVNADPPGSFELLWQHPGAADDVTIAKMALRCPIEHAAFSLDQVLRIRNETMRNESLVARLTWWSGVDKTAAEEWMNSHAIPEKVRRTVAENPYNPFGK